LIDSSECRDGGHPRGSCCDVILRTLGILAQATWYISLCRSLHHSENVTNPKPPRRVRVCAKSGKKTVFNDKIVERFNTCTCPGESPIP
jgi:hypothetical protein